MRAVSGPRARTSPESGDRRRELRAGAPPRPKPASGPPRDGAQSSGDPVRAPASAAPARRRAARVPSVAVAEARPADRRVRRVPRDQRPRPALRRPAVRRRRQHRRLLPPVCPARTPKPENCRYYPAAAAAVAAGFRACRRCRPDALPGTRDWDARGDLAARALRAIGDGAVDELGVDGLADRLHVSARHLHRVLVAEVGASPLQLARTRRAQLARMLLDQTALPMADVAFARGVRERPAVQRRHAGPLRRAAVRAAAGPAAGCRPAGRRPRARRTAPCSPCGCATRCRSTARRGCGTCATARCRASSGSEPDGAFTRLLRGRVRAGRRDGHRADRATGSCTRGSRSRRSPTSRRPSARLRRWLDLDADPALIDAALAADPLLAPLVAARPGLRVPGTVDPFELAVRAVLGQQVSTAGARTLAGRLVAAHGAAGRRTACARSRPRRRSPRSGRTASRAMGLTGAAGGDDRAPGRGGRGRPAPGAGGGPRGGAARAARAARHRAVDGGLRRAAGARRPGRVPGRRPRAAVRARGPAGRRGCAGGRPRGDGAGRGLAAVAGLRRAAPVVGLGRPRATPVRCPNPARSTPRRGR